MFFTDKEVIVLRTTLIIGLIAFVLLVIMLVFPEKFETWRTPQVRTVQNDIDDTLDAMEDLIVGKTLEMSTMQPGLRATVDNDIVLLPNPDIGYKGIQLKHMLKISNATENGRVEETISINDISKLVIGQISYDSRSNCYYLEGSVTDGYVSVGITYNGRIKGVGKSSANVYHLKEGVRLAIGDYNRLARLRSLMTDLLNYYQSKATTNESKVPPL